MTSRRQKLDNCQVANLQKEIAYDYAMLLYKQFTIVRQDGRNNQDKNYEDNLINQ